MMRARVHLITSSPSRELGIRLGITAALIVAVDLVFALVSALEPGAGARSSGSGWLFAIGACVALGFAPLACALHRGYRRSSSAFDVTLEGTPGGLLGRSLWGDRALTVHDVLGACAIDRAPEATLVITLRDGPTWLLELEDARSLASARSALGLSGRFSGRVRLTVRSTTGGVGCARLLSAGVVALLCIARGAVAGSYAGGYLITLGALIALLPIAIGIVVELNDVKAYETITIGEDEVRLDRVAGGRLLGPFQIVKCPDVLEIRSGNRPPTRVYEAELVSVPVTPLIARCIEAASTDR